MSTFSVANIPDMTGKTVIVTGANSGIGLAAAHALTGARVVFAVRRGEYVLQMATANCWYRNFGMKREQQRATKSSR